MKEVKIFARAGQGAITTAAILGEAFFYQGIYAYAFPHFGAARMGAPMNAFLRFDSKPVRLRSQVYSPDYIVVIDPTLLSTENCFSGMREGSIAVISTRENTQVPKVSGAVKLVLIPAEKIALEVTGKPFTNTVLLGAFASATGEVKLESIFEAIKQRFSEKPDVLEKNIAAVKKGHEAAARI